MRSYRAYGLTIQSDLSLPDFPPAAPGSDLTIRVESPRLIPPEYFAQPAYFRIESEEAVLSFKQIGFVRLLKGNEMIITPEPGVVDKTLQALATGHGLATILFQRGMLVLHASAVDMGGEVVAFVGAQGAGKTALAQALSRRGHKALADDIGAISLGDGHPTLTPATEGSPLPLKRAYLLEPSDAPEIVAIKPQEAVVELVRHSYPTRLAQPGGASHFGACVALIRSVGLFRLKRGPSLEGMDAIAEMVEKHLLTNGGPRG